jgi:hypothetical protein
MLHLQALASNYKHSHGDNLEIIINVMMLKKQSALK